MKLLETLIDIVKKLLGIKKPPEKPALVEKTPEDEGFTDKTLMDSYSIENSMDALVRAKKESLQKDLTPLFKTPRLRDELSKLLEKNKELHDLIIDLNSYAQDNFEQTVTITMIYRTQAEQDYLYRNSERYQKKKFKSPHQFWQAVDVRSLDFTERQIKELVDWINARMNPTNYYRWTAKCHEVGGNGRHFHIQYLRKKSTTKKKSKLSVKKATNTKRKSTRKRRTA